MKPLMVTKISNKEFSAAAYIYIYINTVRQYFYYCFDLVFMSLGLGSFHDYCSFTDRKPGIHLLYMNCSIQK